MKILFYILSAILLIPLLFLVYTGFNIDSDMFLHIMSTTLFLQIKNTLFLLLYVFLFSSIIAIPFAYIYSNYTFPFKKTLEIFLVLPLAIPTFILATIFVEFSIPITSIIGFAFVCSLSLYPYLYLSAKNSMSNISQIYDDIASVHGMSSLYRFFKITLPASIPAIFAGALMIMMESVGDYGTSVITGTPILTTGIYLQWFHYYNPIVASQIALILIGIFFLFTYCFQRIKFNVYNPSGNNIYRKLKKPSTLGYIFIYSYSIIILGCGFLFPVITLIDWTIISYEMISFSTLFVDTMNSILLAVLSIFLCFIVSMILLYVYRSYKRNAFDNITMSLLKLIYGFPGIIIGISLLALMPFFYEITFFKLIFDSIFVLVLAYTIKYYSLMYANCQNSIRQIPRDIDNVFKIYGYSKFKTFIKMLPTLLSSVFIGIILILIDIFRELTMVLMIQPKNFTTLSTQIFDFSRSEMVYQMGAWGLILIVILSILVFLLHRFIKNDTIIS